MEIDAPGEDVDNLLVRMIVRPRFVARLQAVQGNLTRQSGSVVQLDDSGNEATRWNFFNAWPSKWDGPAFNAKGNDLSINTLTLSCERLELAS